MTRTRILGFAMLVVTLPALGACTDEGSTAEGIPNPSSISLAASHVSLTLSVAIECFLIPQLELGFGSPGATSAPEPGTAMGSLVPAELAPGDTLLRGLVACPAATAEGAADQVRALSYGYGQGCVSDLNGHLTTGTLRFGFQQDSSILELTESEFTDFKRGDSGLDGILEIRGSRDGARVRATVRAFALGIFSPGGAAILSGSFFVTWDPNSLDPEDPLCQRYEVNEANGTMEVGNRTFALIAQEPLEVATCCGFLVSGRVLVSTPGFLPATIDYGDGTCDDRAVMLSGTEEIQLILAGS